MRDFTLSEKPNLLPNLLGQRLRQGEKTVPAIEKSATSEMPNTKVNVKGFLNYLENYCSDERYVRYPMLDNCKTRREAILYLKGLIVEGKEWIE